MSYWSEQHTGQSFVKNGINYQPSTPMVDDMAAIQKLYGANHETRTGDTTYGFNSNADREAYRLSSSRDAPVFTVWDGGGVDTLDFSGFSDNQVINLKRGRTVGCRRDEKECIHCQGHDHRKRQGWGGKRYFYQQPYPEHIDWRRWQELLPVLECAAIDTAES
jgi:serralysin